jgi:predicted ATPase
MIQSLSLKNFKSFEDETLRFANLNVLSGLNSSGKSSVIQALRLINEQKALPGLGPLREYIRSETSNFLVKLSYSQSETVHTLSYFRDGRLSKEVLEDGGTVSDIVSYISADRFGPKNYLPLSVDENVHTVGSYGENIVDFLELLEGKLIELRVPEVLTAFNGKGVMSNIQEWLRRISPGVEFAYKRDTNTDMGRTAFDGHRPVHVGFGLSYTLPIIASIIIHASQVAIGDVNSALLLVENPEAHLHPSGQTMMGKLLSVAASCGLQIVVETHSDHLLNGVRLAVKEGSLANSDVSIYFFKKSNNENPTNVTKLEIDKYGMLDHWPEGVGQNLAY